MRALSGSTRTIWIIAATAVLSLGAGIGLSRLIVSPAEAAANAAPPPAGPITVPVEQRALTNDIVMRGDGTYEDPVSIALETGTIGGPAVVTGQVPEVGTDIVAGTVILEVAGRPVILLTGELPVYRTLRSGVSGPDVVQLRAALAALGIEAGDPTSDVYDASAAAGVRALYAKVGYPAPSVGEEAEAALKGAQEGVRGAEEQVAQAQRQVTAAGDPLARVEADGRVTAAQAQLDDASAELAACQADPDTAGPCPTAPVAAAQAELNSALAARNAAYNPDTSEARAAVAAAQRALGEARTALAEAQAAVITPLPASEVVYLATTPRRVDAVEVRRGSLVSGTSIMTVSGATLQIVGNLDRTDADLITEGTAVVITLPDGSEAAGTVQSVGPMPDEPSQGGEPGMPGGGGTADPNRRQVVVVPGELTEDQRWMLQGSNVRITIPVSSTEGEVMAVPVAALSAGPGGESRLEVLDDGETTTRLVTVETGLAAQGFVEVRPLDGDLEVGDLVVVGTAAAAGDREEAETSEEEPAEGSEESEDAEG